MSVEPVTHKSGQAEPVASNARRSQSSLVFAAHVFGQVDPVKLAHPVSAEQATVVFTPHKGVGLALL
jgi:hypothetical protein